MTCIKTGARVYFPQYGQMLPADLFQINDAILVRVMQKDSLEQGLGFGGNPLNATHEVVSPQGGVNEFWRDDLGIFCVPIECVTELT